MVSLDIFQLAFKPFHESYRVIQKSIKICKARHQKSFSFGSSDFDFLRKKLALGF